MVKIEQRIGTIRLPYGGEAAWQRGVNSHGMAEWIFTLNYEGVYGMGEKYDSLNQKGHCVVNQVEEKFCFQGAHTYCPAPFFFTDTGFSLYASTDEVTAFGFTGSQIRVSVPERTEIYIGTGTPKELIQQYMSIHGPAKLPPKWIFGPWISANHWNTQKQVEQQLKVLENWGYPATVLVVEAWSDEATFYIFNGARYEAKAYGEALKYEDFDFSDSEYWQNPKAMVDKLHKNSIHLVLWQIPVYKKQEPGEALCEQNNLDKSDAMARDLCVKNTDGTPYVIPEGHWFSGSMVPDFTNPKTRESWFGKRQYLIDIGIDGFKTDGGEFIYSDNVVFSDGSKGKEGKNRYAQSYTKAYTEFLGNDHVLFSRAGYAGQHTTPCHWGGDQQSTNEELKSVLTAGLSAALTGIPFWGFDIAGFAGPLPTLDLYRRSTKLACFCPIMQWHSEPDGGQFKELMPGGEGNNERSPWNMAAAYGSPDFIDEMRFWHRLRMNLIPYLYSQALFSVESAAPMMRPLVYNWPKDPMAVKNEDIFMLGEALLVAPLLSEEQSGRNLYLPEGQWYEFFSGKKVHGGQEIFYDAGNYFPVYIRSGQGIALNIPKNDHFGAYVGNDVSAYAGFRLILAGDFGKMRFRDEQGNDFCISWDNTAYDIKGSCYLDPEIIRWR